MKKFIKEYLGNESSSEIDFELYDELYGEWDNDKKDPGDFEQKNIEKAPWANDSYPTNLKSFIKTLQEWESKGATHIEIVYHCDHIGYELSFLKFYEKEHE